MVNRAYVGNLPFTFTATDLEGLFASYGSVRAAEVISDRETGRSRGFGFVEMDSADSLRSAMEALNGKEIQGRPLTVNEARERTPRPSRPGGGGGGDGRGGFGGGGGYERRGPGGGERGGFDRGYERSDRGDRGDRGGGRDRGERRGGGDWGGRSEHGSGRGRR